MNTPDIEIYVKAIHFPQMMNWLAKHFSAVSFSSKAAHLYENGKPVKGKLSNQQGETEVLITPHAAGKSFTSIWFKHNITPWQDDEHCAMSLLQEEDCEIRCSAAGWQESEEEDSEQWWLLSRTEKKRINWA